jgi:signal transduction histidine kinase
VTDSSRGVATDWLPVLREIARASRHDLRNALNGLVVNLEVVRSRKDSLDPSLQQFVQQSVDQAEESVKRAESTISLLTSIVDSIGDDGAINAQMAGPGRVQVGSEVILSIPENISGKT